MAAPTQSNSSAGLPNALHAIAKKIWARRRELDEKSTRGTEEALRRLAAVWRRRPSGRAIALLGAALFATLIALHLLAALALRDMFEQRPQNPKYADLQVEGVAPVVLVARPGTASVLTAGGRTATLSPSDGAPTRVSLAPPRWAVVGGERGSAVATRLGAGTLPHRWLKSIGDHWRRAVWAPVSGLSATYVLPWALQFDPLEVPAAVRPRRLGVHRPCAGCSEIVELSAGSDLVGPLWWQRSSSASQRHLATTPPIGMSRTEVKSSEWSACVTAGRCTALPATPDGRLIITDPRLVAPYLQWLSARTGRVFRLPTTDEWELVARASMPSGGTGVQNMLDSLTEWVCISVPSGPFGECEHGRRGVSGKPYETLVGSERVVGLRLIETLAPRKYD